MLDVPKLGLQHLNSILAYLAETCEDSEHYEDCEAVIESCRTLVRPSPLKRALMETSQSSMDHVKRERDVQHSLMEIFEVRRMAL